jgi:hypothetical protein
MRKLAMYLAGASAAVLAIAWLWRQPDSVNAGAR